MNEGLIIDTIGIDMDGVTQPLFDYQIEEGSKYFGKTTNSSEDELVKDIHAYNIEDIFGVDKKQRDAFWARKIWKYCLGVEPTEGASEMTHKWHEEGRRIVIITSRVYVTNDNLLGAIFREMIRIYLKKYDIYYDDIVFCPEKNSGIPKREACEKEEVKLMLDDKIDNIDLISEIIPVACFNNPWNEGYVNTNMTRCNDFYDVDELIEKEELKRGKVKVYGK